MGSNDLNKLSTWNRARHILCYHIKALSIVLRRDLCSCYHHETIIGSAKIKDDSPFRSLLTLV